MLIDARRLDQAHDRRRTASVGIARGQDTARCKKPSAGLGFLSLLSHFQDCRTRMLLQIFSLSIPGIGSVLKHVTHAASIFCFQLKHGGLYCCHDASPSLD